MTREFLVRDIRELDLVAEEILESAGDIPVFLFYGSMGAGKTSLIKCITDKLGVKEKASSPTFSIANEYLSDSPIYHLDLYRIDDLEEALQAGVEEYLFSGNVCLIEWPELIENMIGEERMEIRIEVLPDRSRKIECTKYEREGEI